MMPESIPVHLVILAGVFRHGGLLSRRCYATVDGSVETHDDFKTKFKQEPVQSDVDSVIKADVTSSEIFIYMKGVPDAPSCGFSNMACR